MLKAQLTKKLWHFDLSINLSVNDDEILVLWGRSGAGKTTVLNCLAGLRKPCAGFVKLDNLTLYSSEEKINLPAHSRNVGCLFQDYLLFPHLTVKQNVMYGLKSARNKRDNSPLEPMELLNSFGVGHLIDRYPGQISGGEKQRVALARALAVNPKLLLLDEPFSALDKQTKLSLRRDLKEIQNRWKIPFVIVTHNEEDAGYLGDRILLLEKGISSELK